MSLTEFFKDKMKYLVALLLSDVLTGGFLWLIEVKDVFILLLMIIWLVPFWVVFFMEYIQKKKYYLHIEQSFHALDQKTLLSEVICEADFQEGRRMHDILKATDLYANNMIEEYKRNAGEYKEYVEMWVHEIKVPLTASKLLIGCHKEPWTRQLETDLDKVEAYVEQVLYYARSTSLEKDFFVKRVSLQEMVSETLKGCARDLIGAKASVEFENLEQFVNADPKWMSFILRQIITNSIKYRRDEPLKLTFSGVREAEGVCLEVWDNGIGIPENDLERVFQKGFTGQNGRNTAKSTGIGLYLCKKLCEKMNLKIRASSHEGTCIAISFPVNSMIEEILE